MSIEGPYLPSGYDINDNEIETEFARPRGAPLLEATEVVDRGASVRSNLRGIWTGFKELLLPDKIYHETVDEYGGGPPIGLIKDVFVDGFSQPVSIVKDLIDVAWHGIRAGFEPDLTRTSVADHERDVTRLLAPLTEQLQGLPLQAAGTGPVADEQAAEQRVAELLTGRTAAGGSTAPLDLQVSRRGDTYSVTAGLTAPDGSKVDLGAYEVSATDGGMVRSEPPRFPAPFLKQAARDMTAEYNRHVDNGSMPRLFGHAGLGGIPEYGRLDTYVPGDGSGLKYHVTYHGYGYNDNHEEEGKQLLGSMRRLLRDTPSLAKYRCLDLTFDESRYSGGGTT